MQIANPIYDTVFKYLLEDNELAKLLLSTILGEKITTLVFKPQERTVDLAAHSLTVYRLDFAATIETDGGEQRQVLIEIQKAKLASDLMRFRRYLGQQYRDPANVQTVKEREDGKVTAPLPLPLLTIYFLGHSLKHSRAPVIRVRRETTDLTTGEPLKDKEPFIEGLTHDSYIIQIPHLHRQHRTELEQMLQIFDQEQAGDDRHSLEIDESEIPERYRPLLRRLQRARAEPEMAEAMIVEDELLAELQALERKADVRVKAAEVQVERERERAEKASERAEKESERAEKASERAEKESERAEEASERAEKERAEKERLLERLRQAGLEP